MIFKQVTTTKQQKLIFLRIFHITLLKVPNQVLSSPLRRQFDYFGTFQETFKDLYMYMKTPADRNSIIKQIF